ncbi:MAG: HdeA/HdeB family chaperone [Microbacteriaceae bacterium]|nr:HdeA/HdeB family chaperone [Microbacteriaceae bacterium]
MSITTKIMAGAGAMALAISLSACGGAAAKAEGTTCKEYLAMSEDQQKQLIKDLDNGKSKPEDITDQALKFVASAFKTACDQKPDKNIKLKDLGNK